MDIDCKPIGKRLRDARKNAGLTQEKLAEMVNLSLPFISNLENGHSEPSLKTLIALANALDVTADTLLCDYIKNAKRPVLESNLQATLARYETDDIDKATELLQMQLDILNG